MADWVRTAPEGFSHPREHGNWRSGRWSIDWTIWREYGDPLIRSGAVGPLSGLDVAVKDVFSVAGYRRAAGVPGFLAESMPATRHADALAALIASGAAVRGIAHTDEFAYSLVGRNTHYGTPPNAAVPGAIPGGSSSGPAAAVGLGLADIGLGTDTAGSIRIPASYQGLWGLRTTHGSVSIDGMVPLAPSFDTIGLLTRNPETLAAASRALLGSVRMPGDWLDQSELVIDRDLLSVLGDGVRALFRAGLERVSDNVDRPLGHVRLGDPVLRAETARLIQAAEAWRQHGGWLTTHPGAVGRDVLERFATAADVDEETERRARLTLSGLRAELDEQLAGRILVLPSAASPAPPLTSNAAELNEVRRSTLKLTSVAGVGGYPALSVPGLVMTTLHASAPVGLSLIGPRGSDLALVELGHRIEGALH